MSMVENNFVFRNIVSLDDTILPAYFDLYESAFPPHERIPVSNFLKAIQNRRAGASQDENLFVVLDAQGNLAAMARYDVSRECQVAYLIYLAAAEKRRGKGLGSLTFWEIVRRLQSEYPPLPALIFEVEDPAHATGPEQEAAVRRIQFYRRLGARRLTGIDYLQTVDFHSGGVPMHLMFYPLLEITPEQAFQKARCILGEAVTLTGEALEFH